MNFWRAPVDNDKNVRKIWEEGMLKAVCNIVDKISVEEGEGNVEIKIKTNVCSDCAGMENSY